MLDAVPLMAQQATRGLTGDADLLTVMDRLPVQSGPPTQECVPPQTGPAMQPNFSKIT